MIDGIETAALTGFDPDRTIDITDGSSGAWYTVGDVMAWLVEGSDGFTTKLGALAAGGGDFHYLNSKLVVTVPEASELMLMGAGLVAVGAFARRRRSAANWA